MKNGLKEHLARYRQIKISVIGRSLILKLEQVRRSRGQNIIFSSCLWHLLGSHPAPIRCLL